MRSTEDSEVRLGTYEMFHRGAPLTESVWEEIDAGAEHGQIWPGGARVCRAYGLGKLKLCVFDATPFAGQQMVAALGISQDGRKIILGIRQGAT